MRLTGLRGPGIYRLAPGGLARVRSGTHPAEADADLGAVLLAGLPAEDVMCLPGAELGIAEAVTTGAASPFAGPHALSGFGRSVLDALTAHLAPVRTDDVSEATR